MDFAHLEDQTLATLLTAGWDGDEDSICQALTYSADCVARDAFNEMLDMRVVEARAQALEDAEFAWNEEADGFGAVESLRELWSI